MKRRLLENKKFLCNNMLRFSSVSFEQSVNNALINGNNEETDGYIHEENRVKCKSFSPRVDG